MNFLKAFVNGLGSFWLASILLVLILVLVLASTFEQGTSTLRDVIDRYYESAVVVHYWGGKYPTPLFGGLVLFPLLFVNLIVGGILRMRVKVSSVGVFIVHLGMVGLFVGGYVEASTAERGSMQVWDPRPQEDRWHEADVFRSPEDWEVAVLGQGPDGTGTEFVIPQDAFEGVGHRGRHRATSGALPFDVVLSGYLSNAALKRLPPERSEEGVEGHVLEEKPEVKADPDRQLMNVPGLYATLEEKPAGEQGEEAEPTVHRAILFGLRREPFAVSIDDHVWSIELRRRSWKLPFRVALERFVHEFHPGTGMPRRFSSYVTVTEERGGNSVDRDVHITMNEPLRYDDYTVYQSGWGPQDPKQRRPDGRMYSIFSVVYNPSDHFLLGIAWSEWALYVIAFGLILHYSMKLGRFINAERDRRFATASTAVVAATLCFLFVGACGSSDPYEGEQTPPVADWPPEIVEVFSNVPLQANGRVKPAYTWANYALLRMNYRRTCKTPDGRKIGPVDWMLDGIFRPDLARTYRCFNVQTKEVMDALGIEIEGRKKRDKYSYDEIVPARFKLIELARQYSHPQDGERGPVEAGIVELWHAVAEFEGLLHFLDFARSPVALPDDEATRSHFDGAATAPLSEVAAQVPRWMLEAVSERREDEAAFRAEVNRATRLSSGAAAHARGSRMQSLFPPTPDQIAEIQALHEQNVAKQLHPEEWLSPYDVVERTVMTPRVETSETHVTMLRALEAMADSASFLEGRGSAGAETERRFREAAEAFQAGGKELAGALGKYDKIELEVTMLRFDPFFKAKWLFVVAFLLMAVTWITRNRWLDVGVWALLGTGAAIAAYGIVLRCILRERPPVSTLYETIIFIAWVSVVALMATELITRRRIALSLAALLGALLLFIAGLYEMLMKEDTLPQLLAVLDTNFWLTTHVTTIIIGYAASIVTAGVAHVYVFGKVFGLLKDDEGFYDGVYRMVYGLCVFALIFSTVGTILGGIWANDSWGRFWGWDPKENGALMIVLWQLAMLHARRGSYIGGFGFSMAAIFLATVVSFSWWGVNQLGYGLHAYGSISGVWLMLFAYYGFEAAVMIAGAGWRFGWPWFATVPVILMTLVLGAWLVTGSVVSALIVLLVCIVVGLLFGLPFLIAHLVRQSNAPAQAR